MTVMGMLSNGRTLMAMASLMFAPVPLEEVSCTFCESIDGHDGCMQCLTTCSTGTFGDLATFVSINTFAYSNIIRL